MPTIQSARSHQRIWQMSDLAGVAKRDQGDRRLDKRRSKMMQHVRISSTRTHLDQSIVKHCRRASVKDCPVWPRCRV